MVCYKLLMVINKGKRIKRGIITWVWLEQIFNPLMVLQ